MRVPGAVVWKIKQGFAQTRDMTAHSLMETHFSITVLHPILRDLTNSESDKVPKGKSWHIGEFERPDVGT